MERVCWPYFDPEYENLNQRINPPSVSIDNTTCSDCTLVKVDSVNRPGILLEVVQVLTDLDLIISKAYISSDGGWFMDVFHVTDQLGNKVTDRKTIEHIEKALGPKVPAVSESKTSRAAKTLSMQSMNKYTAIELSGTDRPGLFSEICAILSTLQFNVVAAEVWTHNRRVACVMYVNDVDTCCPVSDPVRLAAIEEQLGNVLKDRDDDAGGSSRTHFSMGFTHTDRRLHQMMFADRDYEAGGSGCSTPFFRPLISVDGCEEKGYSVINVRCKDRPKLLFDTVCTLTDMQYIVFHASIASDGPYALQEYFIRHKDGCTLDTAEKERVIKCLEAAIQRRVSEGVSLELCARDRVGLLSDVTRVFRENGLSVLRADVTTIGDKAVNVFYVGDSSGNPVDVKTIEALALGKEMGHTKLNVKESPAQCEGGGGGGGGGAKPGFSLGSILERFLA